MGYILVFSLYIISFFTINFLAKLKAGTYKTPLLFYSGFWIIWILISIINSFELYQISLRTYMILFLSILFFSIGFIIKVKPIDKNNYNISSVILNKDLRKKILVIQIIIFIILILYLGKYNNLISSLGPSYARDIVFKQGYLYKSYLEVLLFTWGINVFVYLVALLFIGEFIINKKINANFCISIISIFIQTKIGNGRMTMFEILCIVILIFVFNELGKINILHLLKKFKFSYIIIACLFIYSMNLSYANRLDIELNINNFFSLLYENIEQGFIYFVGPFVSLDVYFSSDILSNNFYAFGKCTFSGITELIDNILTIFGFDYVSGAEIIGNITYDSIHIGNNQEFNAFFTGILNFYLDGGIIGVVILSMLYGIFIAYIFNRYNSNKNIGNLLLLVYSICLCMISSYRLPSSLNYTIILIILFNINKLNGGIRNEYTLVK